MIIVTFVSNFINHHQIPFCDEMYKSLGDSFRFIEAVPMEQERKDMGWSDDSKELPYVHRFYEEEALCGDCIRNCDVLMLGWTGLPKDSDGDRLIRQRMNSGKPVIRVSERIYREGRWKAVSPRGLMAKYDEHVRYKNSPVYMLCAGAYVSGDFKLIGAYPEKLFKWGYFPPLKRYDDATLSSMLYRRGEQLRICFAARLIKLKHPEFVLYAAEILRKEKVDFHIDVVGDGPLRAELSEKIKAGGLEEYITLCGSKNPDEVRSVMEKSHVFIFASNYLEGWGAVVNEAMNSACAVIASSEAGAVPYLIRDGENGLTFDGCSKKDFKNKLLMLTGDSGDTMIRRFQSAAYETIVSLWNAENAAKRLLAFCNQVISGGSIAVPAKGPMSTADVIKAPSFWRTLMEDNHLE
ncbi:glycosyltransferase family 4 protein [Butyrivibrio sp. WCD3002]|uniref:glycosyltransferase family 4 protein n=1 Tax=Butyrivibrio sp. WCD3002 TaxID=1280676 RepID=UPI000409F6D0|nr:glycosyltransferase family 4 protein [Butyrivibrio sp. WCD3002]